MGLRRRGRDGGEGGELVLGGRLGWHPWGRGFHHDVPVLWLEMLSSGGARGNLVIELCLPLARTRGTCSFPVSHRGVF